MILIAMNQRNRIFSVITFYSVFLVFLLAPSMSLAGETGPIEIEFLNETKEQTVDTGTLWLVNDNRYNDNKFLIMQIIDGSGTLNLSQEFINKQYVGTSQESVQFILALHHGEDVWRRSNIFEEIGNLKNALQSFGEIMVESPDKITVHLSELPKREIKFLKHSGKPLKNQDIQVEYHLFNVGHLTVPYPNP